jgi:hypothetical protein
MLKNIIITYKKLGGKLMQTKLIYSYLLVFLLVFILKINKGKLISYFH